MPQASTPHLRTYVGVLSIDTLSLMQLVVDPALLNTPAAFEVNMTGWLWQQLCAHTAALQMALPT